MIKNIELAAWLGSSEKNYSEGVKIFASISNDKHMIRYFISGIPTKIHFSILQRKLENYARINNIKPTSSKVKMLVTAKPVQNLIIEATKKVKPVFERPKIDKNPVVKYEDLPINLQLLYDENGRMMTEMKTFHAELKQLKDDATAQDRRQLLAEEILKRQKSTRENWDVIDSWWNKHLKADPLAQAAEEALAKDRRIKADLAYIRRFLGKEKSREEVELRMKELDKWNIDYGNLTKHFNGIWS